MIVKAKKVVQGRHLLVVLAARHRCVSEFLALDELERTVREMSKDKPNKILSRARETRKRSCAVAEHQQTTTHVQHASCIQTLSLTKKNGILQRLWKARRSLPMFQVSCCLLL
jgi:hypothetical protein